MIRNILFSLVMIGLPMVASEAANLPGATPLTSSFTEKLVVDALLEEKGQSSVDIVIDTPQLPLGNQERNATTVVLEDLRLDEATGRFSAILVGTVGTTPRFNLPLKGRLQPLVNVAVLGKAVARGDTISAADLDWMELSPDRLPKESLTDPDHIIGTEARRRLSPGRVLTNRDVGPPRLVRRGQPVRVVYADGDLRLSAIGTARDDGAFGEPIRVMNPDSNLQVQGVATGPAEVTVGNSVIPGFGY